jgi:DNA-directed RNA polymerase
MIEAGVSAFSFIHDSYGTYGPYVDIMDRILREKFVEIHQENLLEKFKTYMETKYAIHLPEIPERVGDFDITEVINSEYFFT